MKEKKQKHNDEIVYLTPENCSFEKTDGGFLSANFNGEKIDKISVRRCFPFTLPDEYISIRHGDEKAEEIGIIRALSNFGEDTVKHLTLQMDMRYFTPQITRILNTRDEYGYGYFDVMTDKGAVRFTIHMHGNPVARLSETRFIITDIDGNRFEIPNLSLLPVADQRKIDLYI